jgi:hypothetical protein
MLAIITWASPPQTTILPASRTALSMAVANLPDRFQRIDPVAARRLATWVIGAAGFYVIGSIVSRTLFDCISALSILVALYYA